MYGYCADASGPVGTEYILMEKATGVSVRSKWHDLTQQQCGKRAYSFAELEVQISDNPFSATGSLYFKKDVPVELQAPLYKNKDNADDYQSIHDTNLTRVC